MDKHQASQLISRYFPMVCSIVRRHQVSENDFDDMVQEGLLALIAAHEHYDPGSGLSFSTYAAICITRRIRRAIRSASSKKHRPLNESVPLQEQYGLEISVQSPEQILLAKEKLRSVHRNIGLLLSPLEKSILYLYLNKASYQSIAKQLNVSPKTVDNALTRVRRKLKRNRKDML